MIEGLGARRVMVMNWRVLKKNMFTLSAISLTADTAMIGDVSIRP